MVAIYLEYTGFGPVREDGTRCGWGNVLTREEAIEKGLLKEDDENVNI